MAKDFPPVLRRVWFHSHGGGKLRNQSAASPSEPPGFGREGNQVEHMPEELRAQWPDARRTCIFSVDVEDWFHILDVPFSPQLAEWDSLPSRVEKNFLKLLDLFAENNVQVTCFFLGWVAERFPHLVTEAHRQGHEIASHGYSHRLVYSLTQQEFLEDAIKAKAILENIIGSQIRGYRASGFSVTKSTPWFFDTLLEAGYSYDSSLFPGPRGHGGLQTDYYAPFLVGTNSNLLMEFPISVTEVFGKPICFFGGGYLRLFPYAVIRRMASKVLKEGRPVVFYIHPREIDPAHPRLPMKWARRIKSYINLRATETKIRCALKEFEVVSFQSFIASSLMCNALYSVNNNFLSPQVSTVQT